MSNQESFEIYQRIRSGGDPDTILGLVRDGNLLMQLSLVPEKQRRYVLPYMREMPAFLLQSTNPYLNTLVYESPFPSHSSNVVPRSETGFDHDVYHDLYLTPYHAAEIVDFNIDSSKPSCWTSVCSDDHLMRKLFKIYFLSEYHTGPFFQKDYFFEDMNSGRHQNCSPLLVNAVLALACVSRTGASSPR